MVTNIVRAKEVIQDTIDRFSLDLNGTTVFTEAATGNFAVTAPIAAAAGANVYAYSKNSSYGNVYEAFAQTDSIAKALDCAEKIEFVESKAPDLIAKSDIVTNTGFVRPIGSEMVAEMSSSAVVPLMYEPWEYRGEISIKSCWEHNIPVIGTDETDKRIRTQEYVGLLPVQLSLERDLEVMNSRYLILGGGDMAAYSASKLEAAGAEAIVVNPDLSVEDRPHINIQAFDAVVIVDNRSERELIGRDGFIETAELNDAHGIELFHICGKVDFSGLASSLVSHTPDEPAPRGHMSFTAGNLGPRPVIELHTAGLKVGEVAVRSKLASRHFQYRVDNVVQKSVGLDFSDEFKENYSHPDY